MLVLVKLYLSKQQIQKVPTRYDNARLMWGRAPYEFNLPTPLQIIAVLEYGVSLIQL